MLAFIFLCGDKTQRKMNASMPFMFFSVFAKVQIVVRLIVHNMRSTHLFIAKFFTIKIFLLPLHL